MRDARAELSAAIRKSFEFYRHEMSEEPVAPWRDVAFVQLPGDPRLKVARWHDGGWLTDKLKPFPAAPLCWYSVEPVTKAKAGNDG